MQPPISKLSTSPSFNPQVSAPLCFFSFPTVQESGAQSPFSQQVAAPAPSCLESCLILGLGLGAPPQETTYSPFSHQVTVPAPPCPESCLSLEVCWGASPQELIPHPTFLSVCVLQHHGGHRATLSALVSSSHDFGFTHNKSWSNQKDETNINLFYPCIILLPCFLSHSASLVFPLFKSPGPSPPLSASCCACTLLS